MTLVCQYSLSGVVVKLVGLVVNALFTLTEPSGEGSG